jgi:phosphatidylethanolamine/phosphatidyl-N-methylethanolamine N-methyltransferase
MTRDLSDNLNSTALFLSELLLYPQQIGAVLPSSRHLAAVMAGWLPPSPNDYVLELGPGTGAVTQALLRRGLRPDRLVAIEKSARMASLLREHFPGAHIINGDACQLDELLRRRLGDLGRVGAVISSLPLRMFTPEAARELAEKIRLVLHPAGRWVQYSYWLGNGRPDATTRFHRVSTRVVWLNCPPARVSIYEHKPAN